MVVETVMQPLERLHKDVKDAAATLSRDEVRFLVDAYYIWQEQRKRSDNQIRALTESEEPHEAIQWLSGNALMLEKSVQRILGTYTESSELGRWSRSIVGIGPVIAAGLLAHIDITKAPTVGHIWRFAGLDPTVTWEKKQKRPWNAQLKTLCWKAGESFVKVSGHDADIYGQVYLSRKEEEVRKNEAGDFADQAAQVLERKKIGKDTKAREFYEKGQLPPAHIHSRAKRYAVKLFLSAWHEAAYFVEYHEMPPKPYILTGPEHTHYIRPPNQHLIEGWEDVVAAS